MMAAMSGVGLEENKLTRREKKKVGHRDKEGNDNDGKSDNGLQWR